MKYKRLIKKKRRPRYYIVRFVREYLVKEKVPYNALYYGVELLRGDLIQTDMESNDALISLFTPNVKEMKNVKNK